MQYDSAIIEKSAARLYARARSIVITYTVAAVLIGLAVGVAALHSQTAAIVAALVAGAFGYMLGTEKSFQLKLQAQTAMCFVQIERNTARGGSA